MKYDNEKGITIITKMGNVVKVIFSEEDNKEAENTVLDNLMTSYEIRLEKCAVQH